MNSNSAYSAIVIGGSAGSFPIITNILENMPPKFSIPIILCIHRLKHISAGLQETLSLVSKNIVIEPFHNEIIQEKTIYVAPSNYHCIIEEDKRFALSTEDVINFTRPSIDVLFSSAAKAYNSKLIGIILSGANKDGAYGLSEIKKHGGITIVQDPQDAQVNTMPKSAIDMQKPDFILHSESIISCIKNM